MEIEGSIDIAAPPEEIWPFLVEPEKIQQRFSEIKEFRYMDKKKDGVGTTFLIKEQVGSRIYQLHFIITEWIEHRVFAFRMTSGDFYASYEERWTLDPIPDGSRFSFVDRIELKGGLLGRIFEFFQKPKSTDYSHEMLRRFKKTVESQYVQKRPTIPLHLTS